MKGLFDHAQSTRTLVWFSPRFRIVPYLVLSDIHSLIHHGSVRRGPVSDPWTRNNLCEHVSTVCTHKWHVCGKWTHHNANQFQQFHMYSPIIHLKHISGYTLQHLFGDQNRARGTIQQKHRERCYWVLRTFKYTQMWPPFRREIYLQFKIHASISFSYFSVRFTARVSIKCHGRTLKRIRCLPLHNCTCVIAVHVKKPNSRWTSNTVHINTNQIFIQHALAHLWYGVHQK